MFLFGLGTMPAMLGVSFAVNIIGQKLKQRINKLIPVFASILAVIFILRGLNLGIPYISPQMEMNKTEIKKDCCP